MHSQGHGYDLASTERKCPASPHPMVGQQQYIIILLEYWFRNILQAQLLIFNDISLKSQPHLEGYNAILKWLTSKYFYEIDLYEISPNSMFCLHKKDNRAPPPI